MPSAIRSLRRTHLLLAAGAVVALLVTVGLTAGHHPAGHPAASTAPSVRAQWHVELTLPDAYTIPGAPPRLPWPAQGQAALEVAGVGGFGTSGTVRPVPVASVAKLMTAYLVLRDHPMEPDRDGPTLTVPAADAAAYAGQAASGESVVRVEAGERLTERQALEALLLPSADNIAWILAEWDAGGVPAFV